MQIWVCQAEIIGDERKIVLSFGALDELETHHRGRARPFRYLYSRALIHIDRG